jgi:ubiquitin-protein ligase
MFALQRIFKEVKDLEQFPNTYCLYLGQDDSQQDPYKWYALFKGPEETPFSKGIFRL